MKDIILLTKSQAETLIEVLEVELNNPDLGGLKDMREKQTGLIATIEFLKRLIEKRELKPQKIKQHTYQDDNNEKNS